MSPDKYNVDIPDAVITSVLDLLAQVETKLLPFYVAISEDEKKHMPKIADETIPFAQKVDGYMDSEPIYNPPFVNVLETHKDFKNFTKLQAVREKINGLAGKVVNMSIASSSDSYIQFLGYFNSVGQAARNGVPGAKVIYDDLALRFPGHKKATPPTP